MYERVWFDQRDLDFAAARHRRRAERLRLLDIARNGQPGWSASLMSHVFVYLGNRLITTGSRFLPRPKSIPHPTLPNRILTG